MKKTIAILAAAMLLAVSFASCRKMMCHCEGVGPNKAQVEAALSRHLSECVNIADGGQAVYDNGVTITCTY